MVLYVISRYVFCKVFLTGVLGVFKIHIGGF